MKLLLSIFFTMTLLFAQDATIDVIKQVDSLPSIAVEDASINYSDRFKLQFFKSIIADLNVLSIYNVDRHHSMVHFNDADLFINNLNFDYVLRYKMFEGDDSSLNVNIKLFYKTKEVLSKKYKIKQNSMYVFVAHTIAYDLNEYMGMKSVEWMKRKVVFSKMVGLKSSEIVIADYSLSYQHTIVKGGFNIFPKWANKNQSSFYFTSLDSAKPTLKRVDIKSAKVTNILSSDGMLICSDVSKDGNKLLLTMAPNSQPDIYIYNLTSKDYKRITKYGGIDVNAQFMQNKIIFISDRLGYPNIFSKDLNSGEIEQMVFYGKSNSACSANGEYIVYKARESSNLFSKNTFNLHLISTKTDFIRRLTATGINEFPKFSQDGDAILFIKKYKNQSAIGIIRLRYNKNYLFPLKYGRLQAMDW